jgi:Luciferase-like monooxygenase
MLTQQKVAMNCVTVPALSFGIFDHLDHAGGSVRQQYSDRLEIAAACDEAGFLAYHVAEHHGTPHGRAASPNLFLFAVAQRTRKLRLGPMVMLLNLYHPLRAFEEICMVHWPLQPMRAGSRHLPFCRAWVICPLRRICRSRSSKPSTRAFALSDHRLRCEQRSKVRSSRPVRHTSCANSLLETCRSPHRSKRSRPCAQPSSRILLVGLVELDEGFPSRRGRTAPVGLRLSRALRQPARDYCGVGRQVLVRGCLGS